MSGINETPPPKKKPIRWVPIILFFSGVLIQLAALCGEHATDIPFVLRIISPSYSHAVAGAKTLEEKHWLGKNEEGYQEISKILLEYFFTMENGHNNRLRSRDIRIGSIFDSQLMEVHSADNGGISYRRPFFFSITSSNVTFFNNTLAASSPTNFLCDVDRLRKPIEELKTPSILKFTFGMFFFGTIIEIVAFVIESKESKQG